VKVTIIYTPGDDESPALIERTRRRLQRRADDIAEDFA
jgi:hypothetical protein